MHPSFLFSSSQKNSLGTIRNIANVCCVQFSSHSTNFLAFGSADYKTYCYDLRNPKIPWCILAGHDKAVSYVKFLDSETIVTASTDNTLKLWDLNRTTCTGFSTSACSLTISGHTNEKVVFYPILMFDLLAYLLIMVMFWPSFCSFLLLCMTMVSILSSEFCGFVCC